MRWARILEVLRDEGVADVCRRVLPRLWRRLFVTERAAFYDVDLTCARKLITPMVDIRLVVVLGDLVSRFGPELAANFLLEPGDTAQRVARSHVAALALHEGSLVAMLWLAFQAQHASRVLQLTGIENRSVVAKTIAAARRLQRAFDLRQHARPALNWRAAPTPLEPQAQPPA